MLNSLQSGHAKLSDCGSHPTSKLITREVAFPPSTSVMDSPAFVELSSMCATPSALSGRDRLAVCKLSMGVSSTGVTVRFVTASAYMVCIRPSASGTLGRLASDTFSTIHVVVMAGLHTDIRSAPISAFVTLMFTLGAVKEENEITQEEKDSCVTPLYAATTELGRDSDTPSGQGDKLTMPATRDV